MHTLSLLAALPTLLFAGPATTAGLLTVLSVVAGTLLVVLVVHHAHAGRSNPGSPVPGRVSALRERSRRAAFVRLRDPNARGRRRPRSPGLRSSAA
ncbi:MAG: hypothetical protein JWQ81_7744 [Amycolatopsis sp.]|uniref:DUF6412 domain-containing protein n=1 Tax=Amycolatopsis sp. TaxID=37632 RepID=UPI00261DA284|nr:DUF6412 domain-containing protein [Amycolatopsis sp.]MCU1687005.1 hypothetical protein [Amycolatopsis sp.]